MGVASSAVRVLRVASFLAVLGLLAVVFVAPVLALVATLLALVAALVAVLLPFVVVGLLLRGGYLGVARGRTAAWHYLRTRIAALARWVAAVPLAACARLCVWGLGVGRAWGPKALPAALRAVEVGSALAGRGAGVTRAVAARAVPVARLAGGVLLEGVGGAAVGVILVCLADGGGTGAALGLRLLAGGLIGALVGAVVGAARTSLAPQKG